MKKLIILLGLLLFSSGNLCAQQESSGGDAPKISISNIKWSRQIRLPRFTGGGNPIPTAAEKNEPIIEPIHNQGISPLRDYFEYQADLKNETGKKLKGIVWEYFFSTPTELKN